MKKLDKQDIIKVAEQKRHLFLLSRLQDKGSLSPKELSELKKYEGVEDKRDGVVFTQRDLAKVFQINLLTVNRWMKEGMPLEPDGAFNTFNIQKWRYERENKRKDNDEFGNKLKEVKYRLANLKLEQELGLVIPLEKVKTDLRNEIIIIKQKFLALPKQIAPQMVGLDVHDIEELMTKRLREIISGFAKGKYGA